MYAFAFFISIVFSLPFFRFLDFLDPLAGYETRFLTPPQGESDKFSRPPLRGGLKFFFRATRDFFWTPPVHI